MDNLEDKNKRNMNSAGENRPFNPDPIVQARDDSSKFNDGMQPTEIMPITKKPVSVVDATLLPNQFMGMGGIRQAATSPTELLASILRFKWTILAVFVLVAAPAIAAIWTQIVPKYQARAEIRVRPIIPRLVFRTDENGQIPFYDSFVNTQVAIIRSQVVLQRVLERKEKDVQETQWYKKPQQLLVERLYGNSTTHMERLRDTLSVRPRSRTEIIDVSFIDPSAKDAKIIVDAVLEEYIKFIGEQTDKEKVDLSNQLDQQYILLQNDIKSLEDNAAKLSKSLGTSTPQELISSKRLRLDETQARLSDLRQRIDLLELDASRFTTNDSNNIAVAAPNDGIEKQSKYYEDAEWRRLDANVRAIRHNIETSLLTAKHPDAIRADKDLKFAEESLKRRETQLDEQWRDRPKNAAGSPITIADASDPNYVKGVIEYQLARARHEEQLLSEQYSTQDKEFKELFNTAQSLEQENNKLRQKRELFDAVRLRRDQKNMERDVPGSIAVNTWAFASTRPSNDRRIVFTAMSLVMAFGLGGGLAFLRAGRNQAIYTSRDMPYPMQAPLLGYIPVTRIRKSRGKSLYDEITRSRSHLIESVRIVRTALLSRLNGNGSTTLLITSANAGTGKSAFTMMLGKSLAQAGKKVLMIDSDFHKMSLTKQFELSDKSGLMESLSGSSTDRQCVFPTETPGLSIMPAGKRGDDGAVFEQTANGAFKAFISQLRKQYNIILLDSPPILPVADAAILAGQVDGTIIVEREIVSRRASIIDALARLDSAGGRVLGTVFIGTSETGKYGYGYNYGKTR
jgi:succinoglycan biosynthesis transport protein ExoP